MTMKNLFLCSLLFLPHIAHAAPMPAPGKFLEGKTFSEQDAGTSCVVDPQTDSAKSSWPCKVLKFQGLGLLGTTNVSAGWYQRKGSGKNGVAVESEQIVLFETRGLNVEAVWTDVIEVYGEKEAVTGMKLHHSRLGDFLEVKYYSGGTAGAWSEFFIRRGDKWVYLQQDLDGDAAKCLPKDYGIQAKNVDLENERVEVFTPNDNDPNCCPSGKIDLKLSVSGDRLLGKECKFSKKAQSQDR